METAINTNNGNTARNNELDKLLKTFKSNSNYEDITIKDIVKRELLSDEKILYALNADKLSVKNPYDFYGTYILPYYIIPDTQTEPRNYLCYETSFNEVARYNDVFKAQQIIFYVLCCSTMPNSIDAKTHVARHDLIASLIIDRFNWTNLFGAQIHLVSDQSRPLDNHFCARTLIFEQTTSNSILKNGVVVNHGR